MNDVSPARLDLEHVLARYRQAPESRLFAPLADAYHRAGQTDEAVRLLRSGLERHPRYVSALVLLGTCYRDLQQDEDAERAFARVLELDPENLVGLRFRAERARRRGALERAVELLRRALEIDPFDREVQADLGLLTTALERRTREERASVPRPAPSPTPPPVTQPAARPADLSPDWLQGTPPSRPSVPGGPAIPEPPRREPPPPAPSSPAESQGPETVVPPPTIDLRRVARPQGVAPLTDPGSGAAGPAEGTAEVGGAVAPVEPQPGPGFEGEAGWKVTRQDDRITVSPNQPPVRGPIRSVEDRLWSERQAAQAAGRPPVGPGPQPAQASPPPQARPGEPAFPPPVPAVPAAEFATLTLARIYESQGYLQKALAIYDELHRKHPEDAETTARLVALQRRLAGAVEGSPREPAGPLPPTAPAFPETERETAVEWRLLDPTAGAEPHETASHLRQVTQDVREQERARRHTLIGAPAPPPPMPAPEAPPGEDLRRGHPDFERFLAYVRSLRQQP